MIHSPHEPDVVLACIQTFYAVNPDHPGRKLHIPLDEGEIEGVIHSKINTLLLAKPELMTTQPRPAVPAGIERVVDSCTLQDGAVSYCNKPYKLAHISAAVRLIARKPTSKPRITPAGIIIMKDVQDVLSIDDAYAFFPGPEAKQAVHEHALYAIHNTPFTRSPETYHMLGTDAQMSDSEPISSEIHIIEAEAAPSQYQN